MNMALRWQTTRDRQRDVWRVIGLAVLCLSGTARAEVRVPAETGYSEPNPRGARFSAERGVSSWKHGDNKILWFGKFTKPGRIQVRVELRGRQRDSVPLRMTVGGQSRRVEAKIGDDGMTRQSFGEFMIAAPGYQAFELESDYRGDELPADVVALLLDGPAAESSHFNLKPRRNAASVHLFYPVPRGEEVSAFYCEMTGVEDPLWTYYMACGWHRGYFGMQVNSATERRILFSVWDSGNEAVDRKKVAEQDRVQLVAKGDGVYTGSFGNEGTGGQSYFKFDWETGKPQRFLVTADPVDATHTIFAGYYFRWDLNEWMLISSWKAPKEGKWLRGLYSFSENYVGQNGHLHRKAFYGSQWFRNSAGVWRELTKATFTHDPTGRSDRLDRYGGTEGDQFFLSHGGFLPGFAKYGSRIERKASGRNPADMKLPPLPRVR